MTKTKAKTKKATDKPKTRNPARKAMPAKKTSSIAPSDTCLARPIRLLEIIPAPSDDLEAEAKALVDEFAARFTSLAAKTLELCRQNALAELRATLEGPSSVILEFLVGGSLDEPNLVQAIQVFESLGVISSDGSSRKAPAPPATSDPSEPATDTLATIIKQLTSSLDPKQVAAIKSALSIPQQMMFMEAANIAHSDMPDTSSQPSTPPESEAEDDIDKRPDPDDDSAEDPDTLR